MPSNDPIRRFEDIVENIARIERFTAGLSLDAFAVREQTILAVKYALLIISEAATKLGDDAVIYCSDQPWRNIRGLGNRLRHEYDGIDIVRIWLLIERNLPALKEGCLNALIKLRNDRKP